MDLNLINTYVTVIEAGSMTQAAQRLKQPVSRVSRAMARLEQELGLHLVLRTTRSFQVTDAGRKLFREMQPMMKQIADFSRDFKNEGGELTGLVRITGPTDFGYSILSPLIAQLSTLHPSLEFEVNLTDDYVDLVRTETDIGIRAGKLKDSSLKAKLLGISVFKFVASPEYLNKFGIPKRPSELSQHKCIYAPVGPMSQRNEWNVVNGSREEKVKFRAICKVNHKQVALDLARGGFGITLLPTPLVNPFIKNGEVVNVLPNWTLPPAPIHLVYPPQRITSAKVRVVSQFLEEKLKPLMV